MLPKPNTIFCRITPVSLGSVEIPRLICAPNSLYPLVAIGGSNSLNSSSIEKIGRELARTLSFMASRADASIPNGSGHVSLLDGFYLYSLVCEIENLYVFAHFVSRSASGWTYNTVNVTTVNLTPDERYRDFSLPYVLTWIREHTLRMAQRLGSHLEELSDMELVEYQQIYLRPLPPFEIPKVSDDTTRSLTFIV